MTSRLAAGAGDGGLGVSALTAKSTVASGVGARRGRRGRRNAPERMRGWPMLPCAGCRPKILLAQPGEHWLAFESALRSM